MIEKPIGETEIMDQLAPTDPDESDASQMAPATLPSEMDQAQPNLPDQQVVDIQQSVAEQISGASQADWDFVKAEEVLESIAPDAQARDQIRQLQPQLEQQILELEQIIEAAREKRQNEIMAEFAGAELSGVDISSLPEIKLDGDQLALHEDGVPFIQKNEDGSATIETPNGISNLMETLVMAGILAWDLTHGGRSIRILSNTAAEWTMIKFGVDPEEVHKYISKSGVNEKLLFSFNEREIINFFETRINSNRSREIYSFLEGLPKETRTKLLSGERVRGDGILGNSHQLEPQLCQQLIAKLDQSQLRDLELTDVAAKLQSGTQG